MSVWAIVQARLGSSRLPGKVLAPLAGRPLLDWVLVRSQRAHELTGIAVAVPDSDRDAPLRQWLEHRGARWVAGSEDDVLDRYHRAALELGADHIVRLTGDNPLVDPVLIDVLVRAYREAGAEYALLATGWAPPPPGVKRFPQGLDAEIVSRAALATAWRESEDPADREQVTRFFWRQPERYPPVTVGAAEERGEYRLTVDDARDLEFVNAVATRLGDIANFGHEEICRLLDREPELRRLRGPEPLPAQ
jgi:spore coat polysaccharide biosynthesis protein SpsF (cytidylyltransferase family)